MSCNSVRNGSIGPEKLDIFYSRKSIFLREKFYGYGWISPGGEDTSKEFCLDLKLRPGQKVLDIGSGSGGCALYLARQYGVHVHGVDYSQHMVSIANERLCKQETLNKKIKFVQGDIKEVTFPNNSFDAIHCRDVMLHIREKEIVFKRIKDWLKPGGIFLLTDFCKGHAEPTVEFIEWAQHCNFDLITVDGYDKLLRDVGFKVIESKDLTPLFNNLQKKELMYFMAAKEAAVQEFGKEACEYMINLWDQKIAQCEGDLQAWGYFLLTK